jgi:hypothetical protein
MKKNIICDFILLHFSVSFLSNKDTKYLYLNLKILSHMIFQILMAILANITIISSGMGIGFPAITSELLTKGSMPLTADQISWFGIYQ